MIIILLATHVTLFVTGFMAGRFLAEMGSIKQFRKRWLE